MLLLYLYDTTTLQLPYLFQVSLVDYIFKI